MNARGMVNPLGGNSGWRAGFERPTERPPARRARPCCRARREWLPSSRLTPLFEVVTVILPDSTLKAAVCSDDHLSDRRAFTSRWPLCGKLAAIRYVFSEAGLMRERARVECAWFLALAAGPARPLSADCRARPAIFSAACRRTRPHGRGRHQGIEARTNHDVKAVEIWLRGELQKRGVGAAELEWLHFAAPPRISTISPMPSC